MIAREWAWKFAADWIARWNEGNLDRILEHYASDFEMRSPLIVERMGINAGALKGKDAIRPYWQGGIAAEPPLHFELRDVLVGVDSVAIYYHSATRNRMVAEVLTFNGDMQVIRASAHYADASSRPGAL